MTETIFRARYLTRTYLTGEVAVHALRDVSLDIQAGELVVMLGPSGSGKSTLLNIMGGLDRPTSGQLFFRNTELMTLPERGLTFYRREHVGVVFQFYNLIPSLTASSAHPACRRQARRSRHSDRPARASPRSPPA